MTVTHVPKRGLRTVNVSSSWQFIACSRAEVTTTGNKCQRELHGIQGGKMEGWQETQ